jgi:tetratricopeptide (TPR) repeat protein
MREALAAAVVGRNDECRRIAERVLEIARRTNFRTAEAAALHAIGTLELARGRPHEAIAALEPVARILQQVEEPSFIQWSPDLIEAYFRVGRHENARRELEALEQKALATQSVWALATAARCRGLDAVDAEFDSTF